MSALRGLVRVLRQLQLFFAVRPRQPLRLHQFQLRAVVLHSAKGNYAACCNDSDNGQHTGCKQPGDAGSTPVRCAHPPTHYVIIRADLPLGVLAAQLVHAAGESVVSPVAPNTHAVVLAARDEDHLASLETQLLERRIDHRAIREPDRDNELMAIGIPPLTDRTTIKPVTGKLRLLG